MKSAKTIAKSICLLLMISAILSKGAYYDPGQTGQTQDWSVVPTVTGTYPIVTQDLTDDIIDIGTEDQINKKYSKLQVDFDSYVQSYEKDPSKYTNQDLYNYKAQVFDSIVEKGVFPDQIQNYKNQVPQADQIPSETIVSSIGQSFLEMKALYPSTDNPSYILGNNFTRNIFKLPLNGQAKITPWSASYYAMRNGGTSVRYGLNEKNTIGQVDPATGRYRYYYNWSQSVYNYSQPNEHNLYYKSASFAKYVDRYYSSIEKYDLIMGDHSYTGTNYMKFDGAKFVRNGDLPGWFGYCDGWAAAAFTFKKAVRPLTIRAAHGTQVTILPSDAHAFAVQFMARASYKTRWIGARCNGNMNSPSCKSLNPGSFVITIANLIGLNGKVMVCDPMNDTEIWNHPTKAYALRYYNVINGNFSSGPSNVRVPISSVRSCRSAWCRKIAATASPHAVSIVGVFIRLTYVVETQPVHITSALPDKFKTDSFDAYLELDANGNIIGGGWKSEVAHPNFCWMPDPDHPIQGVSDGAVTSFTSASSALTPHAVNASKRGQILKAFLQYVINRTS